MKKYSGIILGSVFLMGFVATPAFSAESKAASAKKEAEASAPQPPLTVPEIFPEDDLADAFSEAGEELTSLAGKQGSPETPKSSFLDKYPPAVDVSKWGGEIRIIVTPDKAMKKDQLLSIQSVKLESDKGEFLGLKSYSPEEKTRDAEFMVNPAILKIETVKVTVSAGIEGEWSQVASLKVEEPKAEETEETPDQASQAAEKKAAPTQPSEAEKPAKKKGWFW